MKLHCPKPPRGLSAAVSEAVARLDLQQLAGDEKVRSLIPAVPHRVYSIHKRNLRSARRLTAATSSSWMVFLLLNGEKLAGAVSLVARGPMRAQAIHPWFPGADLTEAVTLAERAETGLSSTYEFRLLNIPAAQVLAVWLHGRKDDFLIPINPSPREFERKRLLSPAEFIRALLAFLRRHNAGRKRITRQAPESTNPA